MSAPSPLCHPLPSPPPPRPYHRPLPPLPHRCPTCYRNPLQPLLCWSILLHYYVKEAPHHCPRGLFKAPTHWLGPSRMRSRPFTLLNRTTLIELDTMPPLFTLVVKDRWWRTKDNNHLGVACDESMETFEKVDNVSILMDGESEGKCYDYANGKAMRDIREVDKVKANARALVDDNIEMSARGKE